VTVAWTSALRVAYDPALCAAVRRIFVRVVLGWQRRRAASEGLADARSGAIVFAQRFGGALNLNLPLHALVFHPAPPLEDRDVEELTGILRRRIVRYLRQRGVLPREGADPPAADEATADEPLLGLISSASVQGRSAHSGEPDQKIGRRRGARPDSPGELCSEIDGFTLHARTVIAADDRDGLERLARTIARPPIAAERLSLREDGRVVYRLRHAWRDGTTAVAFDPLTFLERLAALVPRPRSHLLTYHGVLAPAASCRDLVVPAPAPATPSTAADRERPPLSKRKRLSWAELLKRVFAIDVLCVRAARVRASSSPPSPMAPPSARSSSISACVPTQQLAPARMPSEPAFAW
jgi:hypothetical protein